MASVTGEREKLAKYGEGWLHLSRAYRQACRRLFSEYKDEFEELKQGITLKAERWIQNHTNKRVYMGRWHTIPKVRTFKYDIRSALEPFRYTVVEAPNYASRGSKYFNLTSFLRSQQKPGDEVIELSQIDYDNSRLPQMEFVVLVNAEEKKRLEVELQRAAKDHVGSLLSND
jgi:hypothetical protein